MMNQEEAGLRKAISDVSTEILKYRKELDHISSTNSTKYNITKIDEVLELKQAECECCGLKEECTPAYMSEVEVSFSGNWVCGLCSEAVKEIITRSSSSSSSAPKTLGMAEAVRGHREICQKFNTTRLNPKLSLTSAMRDIAKRSSLNRTTSNDPPLMPAIKQLVRRSSY